MQKEAAEVLLSEIEPRKGFCAMVLERIAYARRHRARMRLLREATVFFASGLVLVPLAQYAGSEFYSSGFYDYASLLFSDRMVLNSWQDFVYSLVESLPSVAVLLLVTATVALVWSLRRAVESSRLAFTSMPNSGAL